MCSELDKVITEVGDDEYKAVKEGYKESHANTNDPSFGDQLHIIDEALMLVLDQRENEIGKLIPTQ